jgi:hypothetical protein
MVGAFETSVPLLTHRSFKEAESVAVQEATITNSLIIKVNSIDIKPNTTCFKGRVSKLAFSSRVGGGISDNVRLINVELNKIFHFHTTWGKILKPLAPLGFLTFATPVKILERGMVRGDFLPEDDSSIALCCEFKRIGETLSQGILGLYLCNNCGDEINNERVKAIPKVSYCVDCTKLIEKRRN